MVKCPNVCIVKSNLVRILQRSCFSVGLSTFFFFNVGGKNIPNNFGNNFLNLLEVD